MILPSIISIAWFRLGDLGDPGVMSLTDILQLFRQSVNWGPCAPVLSSDHDSKSRAFGGGHSPRIVILIPWRDCTRGWKVLPVVRAWLRINWGTDTQENEGAQGERRFVLHCESVWQKVALTVMVGNGSIYIQTFLCVVFVSILPHGVWPVDYACSINFTMQISSLLLETANKFS